jgi:DNA-binding response OmpR family regulator
LLLIRTLRKIDTPYREVSVRILVADSDPGVASLLQDALSALGYAVDLRDDVLASADQRRHGLIILDAARTVERLRALGCRIPILLLAEPSGDVAKIRELEGVGVLPKPFDLDELRWEVALVVDPTGD